MNHNVESKNFKAYAALQDALMPFRNLSSVNAQRPVGHYQNNVGSKAFLEFGLPDLARVTGHVNAGKLKDALDVLDAITTDFTTAFQKEQDAAVNAYRAFFVSYFADLNDDLDITGDECVQIVLYYPPLTGLYGINASLVSSNGTYYEPATGEIRSQMMFVTEDANFHAEVIIRATGRWTIVGLRELQEQFQGNYNHHGELHRVSKVELKSPLAYTPMIGYAGPDTTSWRDRMIVPAELAKTQVETATDDSSMSSGAQYGRAMSWGYGRFGHGQGIGATAAAMRGRVDAMRGTTGSDIGDAAMLQSGQEPGTFMGGNPNAGTVAELHRRAATHHDPLVGTNLRNIADNLSRVEGLPPMGNDE